MNVVVNLLSETFSGKERRFTRTRELAQSGLWKEAPGSGLVIYNVAKRACGPCSFEFLLEDHSARPRRDVARFRTEKELWAAVEIVIALAHGDRGQPSPALPSPLGKG